MAAQEDKSGISKSDAVRKYLAENPKAGAKAVQQGLAAQGLQVSIPLVNKIKYAKPASTGRKAASSGRRGRPSAGAVNMSDEIRKYMTANPGASRPQIRDALQARGLGVSTSLVNAVYIKAKSSTGQPIAVATRGRPSAGRMRTGTSAGGGALSAMDLLNAKKLVNEFGGADRIRQALDLLDQLS